jgi:membrane fusion protein, multidrug efflux system
MSRSAMQICAAAALLAIGIAGAGAFSGCNRGSVDTTAPIPRVVVIRPERGEAVRSISLPGDVVGYYQSALYAKVTGYLKDIRVDKGDRVRKGQVLAEIEVPELRERLDRARANLTIERLTYQRLDRVWKTDPRLVAREDVDIAYSKQQQAQAEVNELTAMFAYTQIVAPFDGIVTQRFVDPGALIKEGGQSSVTAPMEGTANAGGSAAPVVSVADISKLRVYVYVPQDAVGYVRIGMPVQLKFRELPHHPYAAAITRFAHSLDLATRTMLTEIDIDNTRSEIYPGMYANVTLELERHAEALKLPASAVGHLPGDGYFVMVARGGHLKQVQVRIGISNGIYMEIVSGLTDKEELVKALSGALSDGERVETVLDQHYHLGFEPEMVKSQ